MMSALCERNRTQADTVSALIDVNRTSPRRVSALDHRTPMSQRKLSALARSPPTLGVPMSAFGARTSPVRRRDRTADEGSPPERALRLPEGDQRRPSAAQKSPRHRRDRASQRQNPPPAARVSRFDHPQRASVVRQPPPAAHALACAHGSGRCDRHLANHAPANHGPLEERAPLLDHRRTWGKPSSGWSAGWGRCSFLDFPEYTLRGRFTGCGCGRE